MESVKQKLTNESQIDTEKRRKVDEEYKAFNKEIDSLTRKRKLNNKKTDEVPAKLNKTVVRSTSFDNDDEVDLHEREMKLSLMKVNDAEDRASGTKNPRCKTGKPTIRHSAVVSQQPSREEGKVINLIFIHSYLSPNNWE